MNHLLSTKLLLCSTPQLLQLSNERLTLAKWRSRQHWHLRMCLKWSSLARWMVPLEVPIIDVSRVSIGSKETTNIFCTIEAGGSPHARRDSKEEGAFLRRFFCSCGLLLVFWSRPTWKSVWKQARGWLGGWVCFTATMPVTIKEDSKSLSRSFTSSKPLKAKKNYSRKHGLSTWKFFPRKQGWKKKKHRFSDRSRIWKMFFLAGERERKADLRGQSWCWSRPRPRKTSDQPQQVLAKLKKKVAKTISGLLRTV